MEKLSEQLLTSIRVETLKNEIARFKKRIERNEKEIERLTLKIYEAKLPPGFTIEYANPTRRLFDSEGRRLKV